MDGGGEGQGSLWVESGNGDIHGGDCAAFRGGGIGDCDDDLKRGGTEIIVMLLSNVPQRLLYGYRRSSRQVGGLIRQFSG